MFKKILHAVTCAWCMTWILTSTAATSWRMIWVAAWFWHYNCIDVCDQSLPWFFIARLHWLLNSSVKQIADGIVLLIWYWWLLSFLELVVVECSSKNKKNWFEFLKVWRLKSSYGASCAGWTGFSTRTSNKYLPTSCSASTLNSGLLILYW